MIFFLYRENDPYLSVAPLSIFKDSFLRHGAEVVYHKYSDELEGAIADSVSIGDVVYFYNMGQRTRMDFVRLLESLGCHVINKPSYFGKHQVGTALLEAGLPSIPHKILRKGGLNKDTVLGFGLPCVIKPVFGAGGKRTLIIESAEEIPASLDRDCIIQEYIPEASDEIIRINIVDGSLAGGMRVRNTSGTRVCNLSISADPEPYVPTPGESLAAIRASLVLGLDICGVDMVQSSLGSLIIEVNSVPGFRGVGDLKMKLEDHIIDLIVKRHRGSGAFTQVISDLF